MTELGNSEQDTEQDAEQVTPQVTMQDTPQDTMQVQALITSMENEKYSCIRQSRKMTSIGTY